MHNPQLIKTFTAGADISAYSVVTLDDPCTVVPASDSRDYIGVVERPATAGERVDVIMSGIVEIEADDEVHLHDWLGCDENGHVHPVDCDQDAIGVAMDSAEEGECVPVRIAIHRRVDMQNKVFVDGDNIATDIGANCIVKFDSDGKIAPASANTDLMLGVSREEAGTTQGAYMAFSGIVDVTAGGSITAGSAVTADSTGKAVTGVSTKRHVGYALTNADSGDLVLIVINPGVTA